MYDELDDILLDWEEQAEIDGTTLREYLIINRLEHTHVGAQLMESIKNNRESYNEEGDI